MRGVSIRPGCPSHLNDFCAEWIQAGSTGANASGARGILECGADHHYLSWFSCWEESPGGLDARLKSTKPLKLTQGYYVTGEILVTRSTFCCENPSSIQNPSDQHPSGPARQPIRKFLDLGEMPLVPGRPPGLPQLSQLGSPLRIAASRTARVQLASSFSSKPRLPLPACSAGLSAAEDPSSDLEPVTGPLPKMLRALICMSQQEANSTSFAV